MDISLSTPRLTLREMQESDLVLFRDLEMCPETYRYESAQPNEAHIRKYLEDAKADAHQPSRTRYRLAVTLRPSDEIRGRVTLALLNDSIREWEIGWAIHPDFWRQGLATEAARHLLEFAFHDLHAHRVVAFSHSENLGSIRVMKKLRMHKEGHLRETRQWQNGWADEVICSMLERTWH